MDAFPEGKTESDGRKAGDGYAREVARRTRACRSMAGKKYVAGKELPGVRTMKSAVSLQLQGLPADMKEGPCAGRIYASGRTPERFIASTALWGEEGDRNRNGIATGLRPAASSVAYDLTERFVRANAFRFIAQFA